MTIYFPIPVFGFLALAVDMIKGVPTGYSLYYQVCIYDIAVS
jgi:hypothetical protein